MTSKHRMIGDHKLETEPDVIIWGLAAAPLRNAWTRVRIFCHGSSVSHAHILRR